MPDGGSHETYADHFVPGLGTQAEFRRALGQFATGVTIVTAEGPDGPVGMTANSFSSVSLSPPLVLWCPAKGSNRYSIFAQAAKFSIHILGENQAKLARDFARRGDAFKGLDLDVDLNGVTVFRDCLARFDCSQFALHDAGDHAIVVGHVDQVYKAGGSGLVFAEGRFGGFRDRTQESQRGADAGH